LNRKTIQTATNDFSISRIKHFYTFGKKNMKMVAKFFKYEDKYFNTPFIKKIIVLTQTDLKSASFIIWLYETDDKGMPCILINESGILSKAYEGKTYTEVDITDLKIRFPSQGIFTVIEWLEINENEFRFFYRFRGKGEKCIGSIIEPSIGAYPSTQGDTLILGENGWRKNEIEKSILPRYKNKFHNLSIELELSDM
jgi:hypothetical protein